MITIYLLKGCIHCQVVLNRLKETCNRKICLIFVDRSEVLHLKIKDKRFKSFPIAFTGSPGSRGNPFKKSISLTGSNKIINVINKLEKFKVKELHNSKKLNKNNKFGDLFENENGTTNQGNIKYADRKVKCFGGKCQILNRVSEPCNSFGKKMTMSNLNLGKNECKYSLNEIGFNIPMSNQFGNCKDKMLTFAAGSGGINPVTGKNYYNDEKPNWVQNYDNSYIHFDKNKKNNYGKKHSNLKSNLKRKKIKGKFCKLTTPLGIEISLE